jgi:type IV pilus assembly protein PilY1
MKTTHRLVPLFAALALTVAGGMPSANAADTPIGSTNLGRTPPDLTTSVAPNIAVTFDDSGSMQDFYMGDNRPFDNSSWKTSGKFDPWTCAAVIDPRAAAGTVKAQAMNGVYFNPNVTYTPPKYADGTSFPNADATLKAVWMNGIDVKRKDNNVTPPKTGTYRSNANSNSDFSDARISNLLGDGSKSGNNTLSRWGCTSDGVSPFDGSTKDANGKVYTGGPYYYRLTSTADIMTDGKLDPAKLYVKKNWEFVGLPNTGTNWQNFANWYAYYRTRNMMTRTAMSQAFAKIGNSVRIAWQNMGNDTATPGNSTGDVSVKFGATANLQDIGDMNSAVRAAFYKWLLQVVGGNNTYSRAATIRAGEIFRGPLNKDPSDPYWNGLPNADIPDGQAKDLTCRKNFHMLVTDGYWNDSDKKPSSPQSGGDKPTALITDSTGAGASQTLPDNVNYDPSSANGKVYGNVVAPDLTLSMANIAWYYWATDLQPSLENNVKAYWPDLSLPENSTDTVDPKHPEKNEHVYWNPSNDPATWQHVSQFFVTLGVAGKLNFPGDLDSLLGGALAWPTPANNTATAVDDTWHAAINSRGGYFGASDPTSLVASLVAIINSVTATQSSAVASSLNTGVISTTAQVYVPSFQSADWSGLLTAYGITASGAPDTTPIWEAGDTLTNRSTARVIFTSKGSGKGPGVDFVYANLSTGQKAILDASDPDNTSSSPDNLGSKRVDWIRGIRTEEGKSFRVRTSLLGAIINGQPLYVSYPTSGYRDFFPPSNDTAKTIAPETDAYQKDPKNSYSQFVADNLKRSPTLYVPANDGMLHAIDVSTNAAKGAERWAFIPDAVYRNLWFFSKKLKPDYYPTVDSTPISRDVFFNGAWHTILVGGLRYGGRGIYALDITSAATPSSTDAPKKVLWEFNGSSTDAANLGYTFGQPNIGRLSNGRWVVLVPGGYFPTDITDPGNKVPAAKNTFSSLFVLDAETGAVLAEYQTPPDVTSWGLASPVMGDYNNDQIDDVAFAGDLAGNLWRFDLRDLTKKTVDLLYKPDAQAAGTAPAQPITVMPRLFPDPTSQYFIVVFGTGKFLGNDDRTTNGAVTQSVLGVRDTGLGNPTGPWTKADLVKQEIIQDDKGLRGITQYAAPSDKQKGGWYFDLNIASTPGERVVVTPTALFNTNRAIITTLIPTSADPCDPGRQGALMVIDATTGGAAGGVSGTGNFGDSKYALAGSTVKDPPATGTLAAATMIGGGQVVVPGVTLTGSGNTFSVGAPIWRRRSWRILNDQ